MIRNTRFFVALALVLPILIVNISDAAPAPDITSFDVIQVCSEYQCIDTTINPYNVSIIRGSQLLVTVRQMGYAQYQGATYNGTTVGSIDTARINDNYGITIGFVDTYDCSGHQSGTFTAKAISTRTGQEWTASVYINSVIPNAMIGSTPYETLNNAYNAVVTGETIEVKDMTFVESLTLDNNVDFTLKGGYADDYGSRPGFTILNGVLTIRSGSVIVDGLIIRDTGL
jgi:hypothetical protein